MFLESDPESSNACRSVTLPGDTMLYLRPAERLGAAALSSLVVERGRQCGVPVCHSPVTHGKVLGAFESCVLICEWG